MLLSPEHTGDNFRSKWLISNSMQSIEARSLYKNSLDCAARIFKEEGLLTFWAGAVPRLGRLVLSGGIVFTM